MRTYRHLYPQVCAFSNLYKAWRQAWRGKRCKAAAAAFEQNLDVELLALRRELTTETYQPGADVHFVVHQPKRRLISAAPTRGLCHRG